MLFSEISTSGALEPAAGVDLLADMFGLLFLLVVFLLVLLVLVVCLYCQNEVLKTRDPSVLRGKQQPRTIQESMTSSG